VRTDFEIRPRGPFAWELALDMLGNFPPTAHHRIAPDVTRMAFPLDGTFTPVSVGLRWSSGRLLGEVGGGADAGALRAQVARIFSLDVDGTAYPGVGERDPVVGELMARRPGQRPVLFTSPYECAAWAVISQRISRVQAARIKDRLLLDGCFPPPERLLETAEIPGLAAPKLERLHAVARSALAGDLDPVRLAAMGDAAPAFLRRIPGIGEFWSQGIYARACTAPDAFPGEQASLDAIAALHGLDRPPGRSAAGRHHRPLAAVPHVGDRPAPADGGARGAGADASPPPPGEAGVRALRPLGRAARQRPGSG
jgi:DNA-3-methyladenine glycosylase II